MITETKQKEGVGYSHVLLLLFSFILNGPIGIYCKAGQYGPKVRYCYVKAERQCTIYILVNALNRAKCLVVS